MLIVQGLQLHHAPTSNDWDLEVAKVFQTTTHSLQRMAASNDAGDMSLLEDIACQHTSVPLEDQLGTDYLNDMDEVMSSESSKVVYGMPL